MGAGIVLQNGVVLEVSKVVVWLYDFRNGRFVGFDCMLGYTLRFCMIDGCRSLVL